MPPRYETKFGVVAETVEDPAILACLHKGFADGSSDERRCSWSFAGSFLETGINLSSSCLTLISPSYLIGFCTLVSISLSNLIIN